MKYVSFLFALALIGVAGLANAAEQKSISFGYTSNESFYACSYAEGQASKFLTALGADNVETQCTGGIQPDHQLWPVSLSATFMTSEKGVRTVTLRGHEACDFNVKLIKTILAQVDHEVVSAQSNCWGSEGRYSFVINLK